MTLATRSTKASERLSTMGEGETHFENAIRGRKTATRRGGCKDGGVKRKEVRKDGRKRILDNVKSSRGTSANAAFDPLGRVHSLWTAGGSDVTKV